MQHGKEIEPAGEGELTTQQKDTGGGCETGRQLCRRMGPGGDYIFSPPFGVFSA